MSGRLQRNGCSGTLCNICGGLPSNACQDDVRASGPQKTELASIYSLENRFASRGMRFFSARFLAVADKDSCCNSILALSQLDVASGNCRQPIDGLWNARSARRARISVMNHYRTEETAALKRCGDHWKIIHSLLTGCQKRPARRRRSCGPAATRPPRHPPHHRPKAPSRPRCAPWRPATQERLY